jgi:hypothetical protein
MHGMLLQSTLLIKEEQWIQLRLSKIWYKAEQFMHQAGSYMQSGQIGKANDLYLLAAAMCIEGME